MGMFCIFLFIVSAALAGERARPTLELHAGQPWESTHISVGCCPMLMGDVLRTAAAKGLLHRSKAFAAAGNYDASISILSVAISLVPQDGTIYIERGQMYRAVYEWDRALDDFNRAIDLDSSFADAYFQRGLLYYSILQTGVETRDEALADFERYLTLTPDGQYVEQAAAYIDEINISLEVLREP